MRSIADIARQFFRAARGTSADIFEDAALAALGTHVRFGSALWVRGTFGRGQIQFHRVHGYLLPPAAVQQLTSIGRQFPHPIATCAASPGIALLFHAAGTFSQPGSGAALECARRWGLERQMAIAEIEDGAASGQWLSLHRREDDAPFDEPDRTLLRLLMPHLSEARAVNRALCLARASSEPFLTPGRHRALTLLDGTVLHCGSQVSDYIALGWPHWGGIRLPRPLLQELTREGSMSLTRSGESISARRFSDSLVLTVKRVPLADRLTRREHEVVRYFGAGRGCKEIALRCGLSPATVRDIVQRSYRKLGISSRAQLARLISRAEGRS